MEHPILNKRILFLFSKKKICLFWSAQHVFLYKNEAKQKNACIFYYLFVKYANFVRKKSGFVGSRLGVQSDKRDMIR